MVCFESDPDTRTRHLASEAIGELDDVLKDEFMGSSKRSASSSSSFSLANDDSVANLPKTSLSMLKVTEEYLP